MMRLYSAGNNSKALYNWQHLYLLFSFQACPAVGKHSLQSTNSQWDTLAALRCRGTIYKLRFLRENCYSVVSLMSLWSFKIPESKHSISQSEMWKRPPEKIDARVRKVSGVASRKFNLSCFLQCSHLNSKTLRFFLMPERKSEETKRKV